MAEDHGVEVVQGRLISGVLFFVIEVQGFVEGEVGPTDRTITGIEDVTRQRSWEFLRGISKDIIEVPLLVAEVNTVPNGVFDRRL